MDKKKIILLLIIFLALGLRLYFSFSTQSLSYDSYFAVRQVEHIKETGLPLINDELSSQGRVWIFSPLFYYILAAFSFVLPIAATIKIMGSIFAVSLIIPVYLIAEELTKKPSASLFSALLAAFMPAFFFKTLNSATVYSLLLPLMFFSIYFLMKISEKKSYIYWFILTVFLLPLIHTLSFLFILGLIIFIFLTKIEKLKLKKLEMEAIFFSVIVVFWLSFLIFKKAFLEYGVNIIWQNIPPQILGLYFTKTSLLTVAYNIGIIPFVTGIFIIYDYLFIKKDKKIHLLIGFAFASFLCLWLRLIQADTGMMVIGIVFSILFAVFYEKFFSFGLTLSIITSLFYKKAMQKIKNTKSANNVALFVLYLLILLSAIVPCISYALNTNEFSPTTDELEALNWIKENTNENDTFVATLDEGNLINYVAKRKTLADADFILVKDADQRFEAVEKIMATPYKIVAISLLEKYNINYVYFSRKAQKEYGIIEPRYIKDNCFKIVYDKNIKIYKNTCILK